MAGVFRKAQQEIEENWFHVESDSRSAKIIVDRIIPFGDASSKQLIKALNSIPGTKSVTIYFNYGVKKKPEDSPQFSVFCYGMLYGMYAANRVR